MLAQATLSDINARRAALERGLKDETERYERFDAEWRKVSTELHALREGEGADDDMLAAAEALAEAQMSLEMAEESVLAAEDHHSAAREAESATRIPLLDAERKAQRLETEVRTLSKLLDSAASDLWPPVVDEISVEKGYEAALGAALGDDLEASTNPSSPAHWATIVANGEEPRLPPGVTPLSDLVRAPPALARVLAQIGVVVRTEGEQLRKVLKVGQRLVSKEGDIWRWDGFTAAAEAPTPAARRLAEKNRLGELHVEASSARAAAEASRALADAAQAAVRIAASAEADARAQTRSLARALEEAREKAAAEERKRAGVAARLSALVEATARLAQSRDEAAVKKAEAQEALTSLAATQKLASQLEKARTLAAQERAEAAEARAAMQGIAREAELRERRRHAIVEERRSWAERQARASHQIDEFERRAEEAQQEREDLAEAPDQFLLKRRALMQEIDQAEEARKAASDRRASAETGLNESDRLARHALDAMAQAREARARTEARVEALIARRDQFVRTIQNDLECTPAGLPALAGITHDSELPDVSVVEKLLDELKSDRERLGAVNLRAEEELAEIDQRRASMTAERDDLTEAIRKLRMAITSLNKEGRERLVAAFEVVNGHFKELFTLLFGGGTAELQLVESDDPLEAGLEILARPPGKKPQTMTLLSGGEQALTAMSLIFAVFLTNPSPICVLDEVDAPLDDSNVERFCDLLEEMRKKTDTRFVTITHNPITMARMDRLFGVTMAERGVSQLVSVDLQEAERFLEAV